MTKWWQKIVHIPSHLGRSSCDLLYPPTCLACHAPIQKPAATTNGNSSQNVAADNRTGHFCESCYRRLVARDRNICRRCGALVDAPVELEIRSCVACKDQPFRFVAATTLGSYDDLLRDSVLQAKYPHSEALTRQLGGLLGNVREEMIRSWKCDVIVPIPMFWWRRLRRGTNSSELFAQSLAEQLDLPLSIGGLRRRKNTHTQNDLSPQQRKKNLRNAFAVGRGCRFTGSRVLLVDDILTTGATCNEATRTLLAAGASEVYVAAVARAVLG